MSKRAILFGLVCLIALTALRVSDPYPVEVARNLYFDQLQRLSPRESVPLPIRIVDIDEVSLAAVGQWPWPRHTLAELVDHLSELGAAAIVFDMLFAEPDRLSLARILADPRFAGILGQIDDSGGDAWIDNDEIFAEAIRDRPVVLGVAAVTGTSSQASESQWKAGIVEVGDNPASGLASVFATTDIVASLREAARGIGSVNVDPGAAATVIRQIPLIWKAGDTLLPSLSIEALRVALGESTIVVLGSATAEGAVEAVRVGEFEVPTTTSGQLWVRYRPNDDTLYISALSVLDETRQAGLRDAIEGHIVLVGTSAAGLFDIRTTPLGENVPGVSIHAQVLEQIMLGDYLLRTDWIEGLEFAAFLLLGIVMIVVMSVSGPRLSIPAVAAVGALIVAGSWISFDHYGMLFDASFPVAGGLVAFLAMTSFHYLIADREKRMIRRSFSHYVAPAVLSEIEKSGHHIQLGGEVREVTVMFTDIRGFTSLSERLEPTELVSLLNDLFSELTDQILAEHGTIDKFIGDSIMAFWNAPLETREHRQLACTAALRMRAALKAFNGSIAGQHNPVSLGIGINSGSACVGNMGSRNRFNYSAIGDAVNVAARIEASCRHVAYDVLLSEDTAVETTTFAVLDAGNLDLKGKSHRVPSYILIGNGELKNREDFKELSSRHEELVRALVSSDPDASYPLDACKSLAAAIEPGLIDFYDRLPDRVDDFRRDYPKIKLQRTLV
jgi:adenylate cyclase